MKKPTPRTPTHAHRGALGGRATSRTKIAAARANGRKGGRPAIGGVYACRWPNGDTTLVFARNKTDAIVQLDEVGNADGLTIRHLDRMIIDLVLTDAGRLALPDHTDLDDGPVSIAGREGNLYEVEYPILSGVLDAIADENDRNGVDEDTPKQRKRIAEAVARERERVKAGPKPKASSPLVQQLADRMGAPVALVEQIAAEELDRKFDAGEDVSAHIDWSKATRPGHRDAADERLGRLFALAYLAYVGSVTFRSAEKTYGAIPVGDWWVQLAREVHADQKARRFGPGAAPVELAGKITAADEGVGRSLALAFLAYAGSITFQTAEKTYGKQPAGAYWVNLGAQVNDHHRRRFGSGKVQWPTPEELKREGLPS